MVWHWRRKPKDFADEIQAHLELDADHLIEEGAAPQAARTAARRRFGNVTAAQERFHEHGRLPFADHLMQDAKGAVRAIRRHKGVYAVAILSLAAGIGVTTASLAIRDTVFRNPPPLYRNPDDLTTVFTITPRGFKRGVPAGLYAVWAGQPGAGTAWTAARSSRREEVRLDDQIATASIHAVTPNLFPVLGVQAAVGRTFGGDREDDSASVVLSHRAWQRLFEGRPDIVGRTLWVADRSYTVIGVMPERFWFRDIDESIWTALDAAALSPEDSLDVLVRRPAGLAPAALEASLSAALPAYVRALPAERRALRVNVEGIGGTPAAHAMSLLFPYLLAGCVTLAWLIACANVSVLMIAQWTVREHEFSILASLGANRARIVRMLLTESLLVAIAGGALGIAATFAIHRVILRNAQTLAMFDASIHGDVLAGALLVTLLTGVLTGIAPALYETRRLQANPLAVAASDRVRQRWRHALVVTEIAATVALLVVAGTMVDAYRRTLSADLGFQTRSLLGVGVENPKGVVVGPVLELMKRQPGVADVAAATSAPMMGAPPDLRMVTRDEGAAAVEAEAIRVSPDFFETLGVPVQAGRSFAVTDTEALRVAMVNETLARRLLSTPLAIGERVRFDGAAYTVIGIVGDYRRYPLSVPPPSLYLPLRPDATAATRMQFVLRTPIAAGPLFETLRRDVRRGGAGNLVTSTLAVDQVISIGAAEILAGTAPFVPLITIGLALTAAGIYAVLAFAVARRSKELALRIAIGASATDVLGLVTRHSASLVVIGSTLGIAITFALSRVVRAMGGAGSFLDTPAWPAFLVPALIVAAVSVLATWIPSRRALRLDPATLLRVD